MRAAITRNIYFEIFWAEGIRDIDEPSEEYDLQDDGVHMALKVEFP